MAKSTVLRFHVRIHCGRTGAGGTRAGKRLELAGSVWANTQGCPGVNTSAILENLSSMAARMEGLGGRGLGQCKVLNLGKVRGGMSRGELDPNIYSITYQLNMRSSTCANSYCTSSISLLYPSYGQSRWPRTFPSHCANSAVYFKSFLSCKSTTDKWTHYGMTGTGQSTLYVSRFPRIVPSPTDLGAK